MLNDRKHSALPEVLGLFGIVSNYLGLLLLGSLYLGKLYLWPGLPVLLQQMDVLNLYALFWSGLGFVFTCNSHSWRLAYADV